MRLIAMIAVLTVGGLGTVLAQEGGAEQFKSKTVYDFEDDNVEGDLQRPDGELVNAITQSQTLQPDRDPQRLHS